jgi:hypothetical protein
MSYLRKVFSSVVGKFPEFNDFLSSVESLRTAATVVIESDMAGFGDEFEHFAKSQPPVIQAQLKAIKSSGDDQCRAMRHLWKECATLPSDLDSFRAKNAEFHAKKRELEAARELAQGSRTTAVKTQEALDRAERKGNQSDIKKLVDRLEQAKKKADDDEAAASAAEENWREFEQRYPGEFADLVSRTLEPVVDRKVVELKSLAGIADAVLEAAGKFEYFDDPSNEHLRQKIEELNAIVVE